MPDRAPLRLLPPVEKAALQASLGVDADNLPLNLTPAERLAAQDPGLPARAKESKMDNVTPGWKTTEFWLKALVTLVALPVLYWLSTETTSPIVEMLKSLGGLNPVLALLVPIAGKAVFGFIAWCATKLAGKYGDNRTELKIAALKVAA